MDDKKYYLFCLDDYATASFTSFTKPYFGTTKQFKELVDSFNDGELEGVENAFYHFASGEKTIEYNAGQIKTRFATPIEIIDSRNIEIGANDFEHENIWGYPYYTKHDGIIGKLYLGKIDEWCFIFYNVEIQNLRYSLDKDDADWRKLDGGFWGYPHQLKVTNTTNGFSVKTVLCPLESMLKSEIEARERFGTLEQINLKNFLDDCFGDG